MKIANTGPLNTTPLRRRDRTSGSSGAFAGALNSGSTTPEVAASSEVSSVNSLLSVQEVADPLEGKRQAIKHGEDLLDRLDDLRHGLLVGAYSAEKLDQLLVVIRRQQNHVNDPRLLEILADIELRAAVELAKLGQSN